MTAGATHDGFGPVLALPLSRLQRVAARRLLAAATEIPHVTHHEEADVTLVEAARNMAATVEGSKASLLAYVARACVLALKALPKFCSSLDPDGVTLWMKQYVNLGIAIDTPHGLMVPVISSAGSRSIADLGSCLRELASRARAKQLTPADLEGSCFTISSLGSLGGTGFTPIINPPNVAILGLAQARLRPLWIDGAVVPRLVLPLSLSYDHRVIDGADAARFCSLLRDLLLDVSKLEQP